MEGILDLREIDPADVARVGGKAAGLAALCRIEGLRVPDGFCVTGEVYARVVAGEPALAERIARSARLGADDRDGIRALGDAIRRDFEAVAVPAEVAAAIAGRVGEREAWAVRSSATAEDLPTASFAGQHDTSLNVRGSPAVLAHVRRCWASLFTERAMTYRVRQGFDPRAARMAVVVQRMVDARVSGTSFTADPVTSSRRVTAIEAVAGLGEDLVAGRVDPDGYRVRGGRVIERRVAGAPVLTDAEIERLEHIGRRIEARFGHPQDIEWCLAGDDFHVVQSRPVTTLFPLPPTPEPGLRVYVSVGHQQMMTDAMRPLGLSFFQLTAGRPMFVAGGRLFVDVTKELGSPAGRGFLLNGLGRFDPLVRDALATVIGRREIAEVAADAPGPPPGPPPAAAPTVDDEALVADLAARSRAAFDALREGIRGRSGTDLLDFVHEDVLALRRSLADPRSMGAIVAGMGAATWLDDQLLAWLGEKNAADTLSQSVPNNVTSEMGLALLDVADAVRPHPAVIEHLRRAGDDDLLEGLLELPGGREAHDALAAFLDTYGMRCAGEIDLTRPRWRDRPTTLVPLILGHVERFAPGEARRRFERGRQEAEAKEADLLERLARLPDGERKADETRRTIRRLRSLAGWREYPKYAIVRRYLVYREALLAEAERLVGAGVIADAEDVWYLTFDELREVVRAGWLDPRLLAERRAEHARNERLRPPRVLTSDGEALSGEHRRGDVPAGALIGLPVSAGVVEGRARVVLDLAAADLAEGDILVTAFTDPSWTAAFVAVRGLVTEVGGRMTHGAVIAREYGLPAVVGVPDATRRIVDGQRIRVNGTEGYVEVLG
ncbi:MAG: phosphoenolpyruvate synthase [Myxococcota bacterium]